MKKVDSSLKCIVQCEFFAPKARYKVARASAERSEARRPWNSLENNSSTESAEEDFVLHRLCRSFRA